jgi:hypothetical protein
MYFGVAVSECAWWGAWYVYVCAGGRVCVCVSLWARKDVYSGGCVRRESHPHQGLQHYTLWRSLAELDFKDNDVIKCYHSSNLFSSRLNIVSSQSPRRGQYALPI